MSTAPEAAEPRPDAASALAMLREELAARPEDTRLLVRLGMLLTESGDFPAALDALDQAHYLHPANPQILYNYGLALERAGRPEDARRRYQAALRLRPGYERVEARLAGLAETPPPAAPAPRPRPQPRAEPAPRPAAEPAVLDSRDLPPPPVPGDWEPEELPGPVTLLRSSVMLWLSQPLIWLAVLAVPNTLAALLAPSGVGWASALIWLTALGLAAGPLIQAMARQLFHGDPFAGNPEPWTRRWGAPALLTTLALLGTTGPFCVLLGARVPWDGWLVLLAVLFLTLPFHVVLAPATIRCGLHGQPPGTAIIGALERSSPRLWLHLLILVGLGLGMAALLAFMGVAAAESTRGLGYAVVRTLEVGALCLAESLWAAALTVCGVDAVASATAPAART